MVRLTPSADTVQILWSLRASTGSRAPLRVVGAMTPPLNTPLLLDVVAAELGFVQTVETLAAVVGQTSGTLATPYSSTASHSGSVFVELLFPFGRTRLRRSFDYDAIRRRLGSREGRHRLRVVIIL